MGRSFFKTAFYTLICSCLLITAADAACFDQPPTEKKGEYPGTPTPGDVCSDGTIFVGLSPDTATPMYTTPADHPELGQWSTILKEIGAASSTKGVANTEKARLRLFAKQSNHRLKTNALYICDNAFMHGHADWYLPSESELNLMFNYRYKIKGFNTTGDFPEGLYWSSTEESPLSALSKNFNIGYRINLEKENFVSFRCVRKD